MPFTKIPSVTDARIAAGSEVPRAIIVVVMRQIGRWRNDSRRPFPLSAMPSFFACFLSLR